MRLFKKLLILTGLLLLILSGYVIFNSDTFIEDASTKNGWNLILVDHTNKIPMHYKTTLQTLKNGKQVDARIVKDLSDMLIDARNDNIYMQVSEGYRSMSDQQSILNQRVDHYKNRGFITILAKRYALNYVAAPQTSEHELGLAVDVMGDHRYTTDESVYDWLSHNAYRYGFIERYPKDKTKLTHMKYEPWHYRYVGKKDALKMYEKHYCLEEYIDSLEN